MSKKYNPLPFIEEEDIIPRRDSSSDSSERTLAGSGENEKWEPQRPSGGNNRRGLRDLANSNWAWVIQTGMLSISVTLFVIQYLCSINTGDHNYMRVPMTWSPVNGAIKYQIQHFDLAPVPDTPYVGQGDAVDAKWDWATNSIPDTMVSEAEMRKMNMDPTGALKITDPKTGRVGYRVAVEVFHQLHCLNLLREATHKAHYAPLGGDVAAEDADLHGHLDHCIDALRQFVMCQSDTNVFPFRFPFNDGDPWPDYSSARMCRNFDAVRTWAIEHGVEKGPDEPEH